MLASSSHGIGFRKLVLGGSREPCRLGRGGPQIPKTEMATPWRAQAGLRPLGRAGRGSTVRGRSWVRSGLSIAPRASRRREVRVVRVGAGSDSSRGPLTVGLGDDLPRSRRIRGDAPAGRTSTRFDNKIGGMGHAGRRLDIGPLNGNRRRLAGLMQIGSTG
jgi:hypothetical protein